MSYYDKRISQDNNGNNSLSSTPIKSIHLGKVVEVMDNHRIRVRIKGLDTRITNKSLPICYSLMPMHIHILPKKDEIVRIILSDVATPYDERLWIGPLITNYEYLEEQSYNYGDEITLDEKSFSELSAPIDRSNYPNSSGVFPNKDASVDEQKLLGRGNTEITIGKRIVELKAGKHEKDDISKSNTKNPALIHTRISNDGKSTTSLITADTILLLSHKGNPLLTPIRKEEITDNDLENMFKEAHPLPFGDTLLSFCELVRDAIIEHAHPESGMPPLKTSAINKLLNFDLVSFLSKTVKIN